MFSGGLHLRQEKSPKKDFDGKEHAIPVRWISISRESANQNSNSHLPALPLLFPRPADALNGVNHVFHLFGIRGSAGVDGGVADSPGFIELRLVFQ
jgi:hypothetical protein